MPAHRGSLYHRARAQGLPAREGVRELAPAPEDGARACPPLREVRMSVRSFDYSACRGRASLPP
eukprot:1527857-Pyramimonas_sp.AAC.1